MVTAVQLAPGRGGGAGPHGRRGCLSLCVVLLAGMRTAHGSSFKTGTVQIGAEKIHYLVRDHMLVVPLVAQPVRQLQARPDAVK